ncbi:MAG TPA: sensor histidine kinase [Bacillota bacterium]|nr:sensor histidine kinase [Bacillota bacterium]
MLKRLSNIRFLFIRSHIYAVFITGIILLSVMLTIYVLIEPAWLTSSAIFTFILLYTLMSVIVSFYAGFRSSGTVKERLDYISVLITQYINGKYDSRVHFKEDDELTRIGQELNTLGEKIQSQTKSMQRMAEEKADFAKTAYKSAVIEERQRLARDLHDSVSQQLFALTMMAEASRELIDERPQVAKEHLQDVIEAGHTAQAEMRALLLHLRPVYLSGDSLEKGIGKLIDELKTKCSIQFYVEFEKDLQLRESTEEQVFRMVQEALANILRHAQATEVQLQVVRRGNEVFIHIRDDGIGFDLDKQFENNVSYGMKTMRERSEELGGTFNVRSIKQEGTYIDIRIPYM